jgi:CBS domain-containing protein
MYTSPPSIEENETIDTLVREYAMETDEQAFPVVRDGRLVGMITVEDIRGTPEERWPITRVADVMTPAAQIDTVTPEEDGARALDKFLQRDVYQLPVVREDGPYGRQLVGMLRRRDLARWLQIHTGPPNRNSGSPR